MFYDDQIMLQKQNLNYQLWFGWGLAVLAANYKFL